MFGYLEYGYKKRLYFTRAHIYAGDCDTGLNRNLTKWWFFRSQAPEQEMNSDLRAVDLGAPTAYWEITELREMTHVTPMKTKMWSKLTYNNQQTRMMFASVQERASKQAFWGSYQVFI